MAHAKHIIEGLWVPGNECQEATDFLCRHYHIPCLLHLAHVHAIFEAPALKDACGKELRLLHDIVKQHLQILKNMMYEPSGPFLMALIQ